MDTIRTVVIVTMAIAASLAFVTDSEAQVGNAPGIVNPNLAGEASSWRCLM